LSRALSSRLTCRRNQAPRQQPSTIRERQRCCVGVCNCSRKERVVSAKKKKGQGGGEVGSEEAKETRLESPKAQSVMKDMACQRKDNLRRDFAVVFTSYTCSTFQYFTLLKPHTPPRQSWAGGGKSKGRRGPSLVLLHLPSLSVYHFHTFSRSKQRNAQQKIHPHSSRPINLCRRLRGLLVLKETLGVLGTAWMVLLRPVYFLYVGMDESRCIEKSETKAHCFSEGRWEAHTHKHTNIPIVRRPNRHALKQTQSHNIILRVEGKPVIDPFRQHYQILLLNLDADPTVLSVPDVEVPGAVKAVADLLLGFEEGLEEGEDGRVGGMRKEISMQLTPSQRSCPSRTSKYPEPSRQ